LVLIKGLSSLFVFFRQIKEVADKRGRIGVRHEGSDEELCVLLEICKVEHLPSGYTAQSRG
jgi:hypothetical protein